MRQLSERGRGREPSARFPVGEGRRQEAGGGGRRFTGNPFFSTISLRKSKSVLWSSSSLINARLSRRGQRPLKPSHAGGRVDTLKNGEGRKVLSSRHGLGLAPRLLGFETGIGSERPPCRDVLSKAQSGARPIPFCGMIPGAKRSSRVLAKAGGRRIGAEWRRKRLK